MPSALVDAPRVVPVPRAPGRTDRLPLAVAAVAVLAVLEALGLLALGLTSLDGVFGTGARPDGMLVAVTLLLLAGWVVLCAGGGAAVVDGAGRRLMIAVAGGEIVLLLVLVLAVLLGVDRGWLVALGPLGALPGPVLTLLALGLPVAKLLLATTPSTAGWIRAGGRPVVARTTAVTQHRVLRGITLACIGLALTGVAFLGGRGDTPPAPSTAAVVDAP